MKLIINTGILLLLTAMTLTANIAFANPWYQEEIETSTQWQIMPSKFDYLSLDDPMTRGELAEAIVLTYVRTTGNLPDQWNKEKFSDEVNVYALLASELGFVSGYTDGTFGSGNEVKREELFVMIEKLISNLSPEIQLENEDNTLHQFVDGTEVSDWAQHSASKLVQLGILTGTDKGELEPKTSISRAQAMVVLTRSLKTTGRQPVSTRKSNAELYRIAMMSQETKSYSVSRGGRRSNFNESLYTESELMTMLGNNSVKYAAIFGSADAQRYQTAEESLKHLVDVNIDVWTLKSDGTKVPGTRTIKVHRAIAESIRQIFKEIFEGSEQFPIKDIGGYAWRSKTTSEHRWGLAIDINADENYMFRSDGTVVAGSFWKPGENPYSIKPDGDVVKAFKKYGFSWGGDAWPSSWDYMHFSFLGM